MTWDLEARASLCEDGPFYVKEVGHGRWTVKQELRRIRPSTRIVFEALDRTQALMVVDALNRYHQLFKLGIPQAFRPIPVCGTCRSVVVPTPQAERK